MQAQIVVFEDESNIYYRGNYYGYNHSYSLMWDYSYTHSGEMWLFIFIALTVEATCFSSRMKLENCRLLCIPVTPKQLGNCFR